MRERKAASLDKAIHRISIWAPEGVQWTPAALQRRFEKEHYTVGLARVPE